MKTSDPRNPRLVAVSDDGFETVRSIGPASRKSAWPDSVPVQGPSSQKPAVLSSKNASDAHPSQTIASGTDPDACAGPGITASKLKAKAVAFLARREHSRLELTRKLQALQPDPHLLDQVLAELERDGWQSDTRFAAALVNRRAARKGAAAIVHELKGHGLDPAALAEIRHDLNETEADRARVVYQRKFTQRPADSRDYARQARFLAARGFSSGVIRQILGEMPRSPAAR